MWPDQVSNPGPPTYESGALPIALRGPANTCNDFRIYCNESDVAGKISKSSKSMQNE